MSRREKLLEKMRQSPGTIRFSEVEALLRHSGFIVINRRGSHITFRSVGGRLLVVVRPHGNQETCRADNIRQLLEVLDDDAP